MLCWSWSVLVDVCVLDHVPLRLSGGEGRALGGWRCIITLCGAQSVMTVGHQRCSGGLQAAGLWSSTEGWWEFSLWCWWRCCVAEQSRVQREWDSPVGLSSLPEKTHWLLPQRARWTHLCRSQQTLRNIINFMIFLCIQDNHEFECVCVCFDRFGSVHYSCHNNISSPPVRSTSVSPPQTPPAASLSVPPVLVIVGSCALTALVPLLILIQQNRVMRRGRRDPETVILCLIQCVISHVLWTDSRFVCLHSQLSLRGDTGRRLRPFMRRFSADTITSLRGVRHEPSISFNTINKSPSDSWCSCIISPVKPPASNHRIPDRKPQSYRCMFMCVWQWVSLPVCISGGQWGIGSCEDTCLCVFANRPNKNMVFPSLMFLKCK